MNAGLVMDFIKNRMSQLGMGDNYEVRYRHFSIPVNTTHEFTLPTGNFLILIDPVPTNAIIISEGGAYYFDSRSTVERQHLHWGKVKLENADPDNGADIFVTQIIPYQQNNE